MATTKTAQKNPATKAPVAKAPAAKAPRASAPKTPKKNDFAEGNSKFAEFLKSKKLDARRLIIASFKLEAFRPEDRAIKQVKRAGKAGGGGEGEEKPKETRKPRSGRPITHRAVKAALTGGKLSGPVKTRILHAVNHLLEQKKGEKVDLKALF